ncbi:MAG: hypothetical protein AAF921_01130 [Cyanobacteria bacterium P01_D01_bin.44]
MAVGLSSALMLLMSRIVKYKNVADQVNQACAEHSCPPAFDIQLSPDSEDDDIHIKASKEYRFEGFGLVLGWPLKMSFWVHYVPENADPIEMGRFLIPIGFGDIRKI